MTGETMLSVILGYAGGVVTSWVFYRLGGRDTKAIWHSVTMIARGIEHAGITEYTYDAAGKVVGVKLGTTGHASGDSTAHFAGGSNLASPRPPSVYDRQHENPEPTSPEGSTDLVNG